MQEQIQDFIEAMRAAGIGPSDPNAIQADDTARYYHVDGDKPKTLKASYALEIREDGFALGWFMSHRTGEKHSWHSKSKRKSSPEEREQYKAKLETNRARIADQRKRDADHAKQEAAKFWATAAKEGVSPYFERKGVSVSGIRYSGETAIIPMWRDGKLAGLQRILKDGDKLFMKGSDIDGSYFSIRGDMQNIAICEGVATGATINMATGWSVICAFNAGNLKSVAKSIRAKYQEAQIVICADNDHETAVKRPDIGNVGMDKAQQAAVAIGGAHVMAPASDEGISDWNDIHARHGIDAVRDGLTPKPIEPAPPADEISLIEDEFNPADPLDTIRPLGHDRGEYFFFPRSTGQIMSFSASSLGRSQNLYQLAPKGFWMALYAPEEKIATICDYASAQLIEVCHGKGIFSIENARGVGAWKDGDKFIVNCGDVIIGDGIKVHPSEFKGVAVYEAGKRVINLDVSPLSAKEALEFYEICRMFKWKKPQYGILFAGWVVVSSIGGALRWRPHISIAGPRGSGKSFVMDNVLKPAIGQIAVTMDGGTTEAGVRKNIGVSSRPFIMDEAESETQKDRAEMEKIIGLFRKASSGGRVANAYGEFIARFCACISAINPRVEHGADESRNTLLELAAHNGDREAFKVMRSKVKSLIKGDFSNRLFARTVSMIETIMFNIEIFEDVLTDEFGSARDAEQLAPMIAGALSLVSDKKITPEFAKDWIGKQDWQWRTSSTDNTDAERLVSKIMTSRVRYDIDGMIRESSVFDLVSKAMDQGSIHYDHAVHALGSAGIKVDGDRLLISNKSAHLTTALANTAWAVWVRTLSDYEGAHKNDNRVVYFKSSGSSKAVSIPLHSALGVEKEVEEEFSMEGF